MLNRQLRQNVRNLLFPMTLAEMQIERVLSVERGDTERARYVEEFIREVEADSVVFVNSVECEGCYCNPCECLPDDCNCDPL